MISYSALIVIANVKIMIFSNTFSWLSIICLALSILFYPLIYWLINKHHLFDIYGYFDRTAT